jgi:hypothetical protein
MTPQQFETDLRAFAAHLLAPALDGDKKPVVKHQVINAERPLKVRLGLRVTGVDPEIIKGLADSPAAVRDAWLHVWPINTPGMRDAKSVAIAGDDKHVLIDLLFFTLQLTTPDSLTPAAPHVSTAN